MNRRNMAIVFLSAVLCFVAGVALSVERKPRVGHPEEPFLVDTTMPPKTYVGFDSVSSNLLIGLAPLPESPEPKLVEIRDNGKLIYARKHDGSWVDNRIPPKGLYDR